MLTTAPLLAMAMPAVIDAGVTPALRAERLLLVLPLPVYRCDGRLFYDAQALNGLRLWLGNFASVTVMNPVIDVAVPPPATREFQPMLEDGRLEVILLPGAWSPIRFLATLLPTVQLLRAQIARATDLQFAIGGFWGDWGAVAGLIAGGMGRRAAVWTDRVESQVMRFAATERTGFRRLYRLLNARLAEMLERAVIRRAAVGLFHGMDTYRAYARFSPSPHLVHDIHIGPEARIDGAALQAKQARDPKRPLEIVYGGRAHRDKGVLDWVEALAIARDAGMDFRASWYGDGPELEAARALVAEQGLADRVQFPGGLSDHGALMARFRAADIFLFCHKTPESPRCLVEALLAGTPIVGYDSSYPDDLIAVHRGGVLTEQAPEMLAEALLALDGDRAQVADLAGRAARDGFPLVDEEVFRHRSEIIRAL